MAFLGGQPHLLHPGASGIRCNLETPLGGQPLVLRTCFPPLQNRRPCCRMPSVLKTVVSCSDQLPVASHGKVNRVSVTCTSEISHPRCVYTDAPSPSLSVPQPERSGGLEKQHSFTHRPRETHLGDSVWKGYTMWWWHRVSSISSRDRALAWRLPMQLPTFCLITETGSCRGRSESFRIEDSGGEDFVTLRTRTLASKQISLFLGA